LQNGIVPLIQIVLFIGTLDKYFGDRIESGISIIDDMIVDKSLDIEWFGINEEDLITGASHD
jgi:hypothetical protein